MKIVMVCYAAAIIFMGTYKHRVVTCDKAADVYCLECRCDGSDCKMCVDR